MNDDSMFDDMLRVTLALPREQVLKLADAHEALAAVQAEGDEDDRIVAGLHAKYAKCLRDWAKTQKA